jgi:hypothetical protein
LHGETFSRDGDTGRGVGANDIKGGARGGVDLPADAVTQ